MILLDFWGIRLDLEIQTIPKMGRKWYQQVSFRFRHASTM